MKLYNFCFLCTVNILTSINEIYFLLRKDVAILYDFDDFSHLLLSSGKWNISGVYNLVNVFTRFDQRIGYFHLWRFLSILPRITFFSIGFKLCPKYSIFYLFLLITLSLILVRLTSTRWSIFLFISISKAFIHISSVLLLVQVSYV